MTKWTKVMALAIAILLVAAPTAAADSEGLQERPYRAVWSGTVVMFEEGPDWCPAGYTPVHIEGSGTGSHIGAFHVEAWHCTSPLGEIVLGVEVITAANGDELHGTYTGQLFPLTDTDGTSMIYHDLSGGTGRFASLTSELDPSYGWHVFTSLTGGVLGGVVEGTISYDASDRSD